MQHSNQRVTSLSLHLLQPLLLLSQNIDQEVDTLKIGSASQENLLKALLPLQDVAFVAVGVALGVIHQLHLAPNNKFGHRISTECEKNSLIQALNNINANSHMTQYSNWPESYNNSIHNGLPTDAHHVVICGIHAFPSSSSSNCIVGDVTFIASGGDPMTNYTNIPIHLHVLSAIIAKYDKDPWKETYFC